MRKYGVSKAARKATKLPKLQHGAVIPVVRTDPLFGSILSVQGLNVFGAERYRFPCIAFVAILGGPISRKRTGKRVPSLPG